MTEWLDWMLTQDPDLIAGFAFGVLLWVGLTYWRGGKK